MWYDWPGGGGLCLWHDPRVLVKHAAIQGVILCQTAQTVLKQLGRWASISNTKQVDLKYFEHNFFNCYFLFSFSSSNQRLYCGVLEIIVWHVQLWPWVVGHGEVSAPAKGGGALGTGFICKSIYLFISLFLIFFSFFSSLWLSFLIFYISMSLLSPPAPGGPPAWSCCCSSQPRSSSPRPPPRSTGCCYCTPEGGRRKRRRRMGRRGRRWRRRRIVYPSIVHIFPSRIEYGAPGHTRPHKLDKGAQNICAEKEGVFRNLGKSFEKIFSKPCLAILITASPFAL